MEIDKYSFVPIKGFEGYYEINRAGEVYSLDRIDSRGRKLKRRKMKHTKCNGYLTVALSKNGYGRPFGVHRLIAIAFIPNPEGKPSVNHIDSNKTNNNIENLEWVTQQENTIHSVKNFKALGLPWGAGCTEKNWQRK